MRIRISQAWTYRRATSFAKSKKRIPCLGSGECMLPSSSLAFLCLPEPVDASWPRIVGSMPSSRNRGSRTSQSPTRSRRLLVMSGGVSIFATSKSIVFDADQRLVLCHHHHGCLFASHSLQRYFSKPGSLLCLDCLV